MIFEIILIGKMWPWAADITFHFSFFKPFLVWWYLTTVNSFESTLECLTKRKWYKQAKAPTETLTYFVRPTDQNECHLSHQFRYSLALYTHLEYEILWLIKFSKKKYFCFFFVFNYYMSDIDSIRCFRCQQPKKKRKLSIQCVQFIYTKSKKRLSSELWNAFSDISATNHENTAANPYHHFAAKRTYKHV